MVVEGSGILIARGMSRAERAMLTGLAQIILRVPENAPIRYLAESELRRISTADSEHYRTAAVRNTAETETLTLTK